MRWTRRPVAVALANAFVFTGAVGSDEATTKRLAAVAKEKLGSIHAAVLVARGEETVLHEGFGAADADAKRAIDRDTVFAIGSITKLFTAAAILRLEQDGKLATGDALGDHLDGVPEDTRQLPSDVVTLRIDPRTGEPASPDQQNALFEYFLADHTPTTRASSQATTDVDSKQPVRPIDIF